MVDDHVCQEKTNFSHLAGFGARPSCVAAFGHEAMDCGLLSTGNLAMGKPCGKAMWVFYAFFWDS